jgi:hypothetical protein
VLTPMRATTLDATIGVRALALIAEEEEALGRAIRHAIVFTMTRAILSKQHKAIEVSLRGQGVDVIRPPLMERAAFSALFEFGGDLRTMPAPGENGNQPPRTPRCSRRPSINAFWSKINERDPDYLLAQRKELRKRPFSFDGIGLSLLVIVIVCWEVMLSKGQEWDWLGDPSWRVQTAAPSSLLSRLALVMPP